MLKIYIIALKFFKYTRRIFQSCIFTKHHLYNAFKSFSFSDHLTSTHFYVNYFSCWVRTHNRRKIEIAMLPRIYVTTLTMYEAARLYYFILILKCQYLFYLLTAHYTIINASQPSDNET